ncbi:hypothetical protein OSB04_014916 [Centaurea solstitialis]|uniref:non-specific serine/threonine protein kinase n=1 Tax=Centaurea solstitialis TaxID=347529 RepID=A0AA38T972_9ASTR|nr:hypothetical protein OSB04_014916 [Centaurea solstitialis]
MSNSMAFASASKITSSVGDDTTCYDVFLSFRFEDTDNDEIDRDEELKPEIERAIKASKGFNNCLVTELCFFHMQEETLKIEVKTVAKSTHDNVERWKVALTEVANLTGCVLSGPETKFLKEIVDTIYKELDCKEVHLPPNLTRMDTRYEEITSWLSQSNLEYLAICGMGGSGKTTLANSKSSDLKTDALQDMDKLKLLQLNFVELIGSHENFSEDLRWLCWKSDAHAFGVVLLEGVCSNGREMFAHGSKQRPTMAGVVLSLESILMLQVDFNKGGKTIFDRMVDMLPLNAGVRALMNLRPKMHESTGKMPSTRHPWRLDTAKNLDQNHQRRWIDKETFTDLPNAYQEGQQQLPKVMLPVSPKVTETSFLAPDKICQRFSPDDIRSATQNFDDSLVVGRGGFGKVYKGSIGDTVVAIKISNSMSNQGAVEFQAEVEMLSRIRHCNLVSLIGYSYKGKEMALVYEYMPQGTLEDHLYKDGSRLSWLQLLKICKGAARGLDYLHTGTGTQHGIIHRDVKSSNVLLDMNFAAKISDFGIAKIGPTNQTRTHVSTLVKGTFGYMDPRYVYTGNLTTKSDVYSFGVLLLEVLCGRPAVDTRLDEEQMGLAPWAQDCIKKGKLNNIIDSRLRGQISSNCLKDFARIACRCLDNNPNQRPTMADIIGKLDVILSLQERLDSSVTEGKLIDKVQWFFGAKVESKASNLMASRPSGSEGEPNGKESNKVKNAIIKTGKAKVDYGQKDHVIETSDTEGTSEPSDKSGKVTSSLVAPSSESGLSGTDRNLKAFSYNVIKMATRNFRPDKVLGEGNIGLVFKGWFDEESLEATKAGTGTVFAVKALKKESPQNDKEWLAGINHLSMLNHPNLVRLIGYCLEDNQRLLVYDFIPRGSLAHHLFRRAPDIAPLPWKLRTKIVLGAAKGLAYIHNKEPKMMCFDINSHCILVDSDYNAKLSNRLWGMHEPLAPEYHGNVLCVDEMDDVDVPTGCSTPREEIYNFGVVLLEVFTGEQIFHHDRPPSCERVQVNHYRPLLDNKEEIKRIIDDGVRFNLTDRLDGEYATSVAVRFAMIAKRCLSNWTTADKVVQALEALQDI